MKKTADRPHFDVTAGLIFRSGKVLISRRRKGSHLGGMWEFPGGKREAGESLEECLVRELVEELGIRTRVEHHCLTVHHSYDDRSISLHVFHCTLLKGDPEPLQSDEIKWVATSALEELVFPPPDKDVIAYLNAYYDEKGGYDVLRKG